MMEKKRKRAGYMDGRRGRTNIGRLFAAAHIDMCLRLTAHRR